MAHFPVDHPLRGAYRLLALVIGLALAVFGVVAYLQTRDASLLAKDPERVWGLSANPVFGVFALVVGIALVLGVVVGRNLDVSLNIGLGVLLMVVGAVGLCLIRSDANVIAASITNVNVLFVLGMLLLAAGFYCKSSRGVKREGRQVPVGQETVGAQHMS